MEQNFRRFVPIGMKGLPQNVVHNCQSDFVENFSSIILLFNRNLRVYSLKWLAPMVRLSI